MSALFRRLSTVLVFTLLACLPAHAGRGELFLIGGGIRTPELIREIGKAAGGGSARILIVPWATANPDAAVKGLQKQFSSFGPSWVEAAPSFPEKLNPNADKFEVCRESARVPRTVRDVFNSETRTRFISDLSVANVVYFTGGAQNRILRVVGEDLQIQKALREFHERGGLYVGTSAGTAATPALMMSGKVSKMPDGTDVAKLTPGLSLLPAGIRIDQHFVQRGRYDRLRNLIVQNPGDLGIGISESTAAIFHADGTFSIVGDSLVLVYFRKTKESPITEVQLVRGDRFDLQTRRKL